jgi:hypothetical protein
VTGEYSAREAELRVKKSQTLKNIKKVMKKAALKKATSALIFNSQKNEQKTSLENPSIGETEEMKVKKKILVDAAMKILFPSYLDNYEDEEPSICGNNSEVDDEVEEEIEDDMKEEVEAVEEVMIGGVKMLANSDSDSNDGSDRSSDRAAVAAVTTSDCIGEDFILKEKKMKPTARIKTKTKTGTLSGAHQGAAPVSKLRGGGRVHARFLRLVQTCPLWSLSLQMEEGDVVRIGGRRVLEVDLLQDLHSEKGKGSEIGSDDAVSATAGEGEEGRVSCSLSGTQQVQGTHLDPDPLPVPLSLGVCIPHPVSDFGLPCPASSESEELRLEQESELGTAAEVRIDSVGQIETEIETAVRGGGQSPVDLFTSVQSPLSSGDTGVAGGEGGVEGSPVYQYSLPLSLMPSLPLPVVGVWGEGGRRVLAEFPLQEVAESLKNRLETAALILPIILFLYATPNQLCPPVSAADLNLKSSDMDHLRVFLHNCAVPPSHTSSALHPSITDPPPITPDASIYHPQFSSEPLSLSLPLSLPLIRAQLTALISTLNDIHSSSAASSKLEGVLHACHVDSTADEVKERSRGSESTGQGPKEGRTAEGGASDLESNAEGRAVHGGEAMREAVAEAEVEVEGEVVGDIKVIQIADERTNVNEIKEVEGDTGLDEITVRSKHGAPPSAVAAVGAAVVKIRSGTERTFDLSLIIPPSPSYTHSHFNSSSSSSSIIAAHLHRESRVQVQTPLPHPISTSSISPSPSHPSSPAQRIGSQLPDTHHLSALPSLSTPHTVPPIPLSMPIPVAALLAAPTATLLSPNLEGDTALPEFTATAETSKRKTANGATLDAVWGAEIVSDTVNDSATGGDREMEMEINMNGTSKGTGKGRGRGHSLAGTDLSMSLYSMYGVMEGGSSTYKAANVLDLTSSQRSRSQSQSQSSSVALQGVSRKRSSFPSQGPLTLSFSCVHGAQQQKGDGEEEYPDKILDIQSGSSAGNGDGDEGETERTFITGAGYHNGTRDGAADTLEGGGGGGGGGGKEGGSVIQGEGEADCHTASLIQPSIEREREREREREFPPSPIDSSAPSQSQSQSAVDVDVDGSDSFYGDGAYDFLPGDVSGCVLRYNGNTENGGDSRSAKGNAFRSGNSELRNIFNAKDGRKNIENNQSEHFLDLSQKSSDMESVEIFNQNSSRVPKECSADSQESSRSRSPYSVSWEPSISQVGRSNLLEKPSKNGGSPTSAASPVPVPVPVPVFETRSPMKGEYSYLEERLQRIKESSLQADSEADTRFTEKTRGAGAGAGAGIGGLSSAAFETHRRAAKRELSEAFSTRPLPSCAALPLPSSYPSYFPPSVSSSSSSSSRRADTVDLRDDADAGVGVDVDTDGPSQKPTGESRNIQREGNRVRRGGKENFSEREEEEEEDVWEMEEIWGDISVKESARIGHTQDRGQKRGVEQRTSMSMDKHDYEYEYGYVECKGRDRGKDKDNDSDSDSGRGSLISGVAGTREESKKINGKSRKKKSGNSETENASKTVQKFSASDHFYRSGRETKYADFEKASTTTTTFAATSVTTSGTACKNPVISVDIFKSPVEPVFEIYSLAELQRLCGFYGLKKDTKSRLCSIFKTMWSKTRALMASTSSSTTLPSSSSSSSSSSTVSSSLPASKAGGSRGRDGGTDSTDSRSHNGDGDGDGNLTSHPSSTNSVPLNTDNSKEKQPEKSTKSRKKKVIDEGPGKEDVPTGAKRQKKAGEREKDRVAQRGGVIEKSNRKARDAERERDADVVCLLENENDEENSNENQFEDNCAEDGGDSGREAGKSEIIQYLRANTDLFMAVICFESLDLDSVHKRMTSDGIKIMKNKLLEILDSEHLFVSCGLDAKARKKETKKANPRPKGRKFRQ